jgi:hypothetical protein
MFGYQGLRYHRREDVFGYDLHPPRFRPRPFFNIFNNNIIGYEIRKKPTFWNCLTGTRPRPRIFFNDHTRRSRVDLLDYERACYEEDFVRPRRYHAPPHRHHHGDIYERVTERLIPHCPGCLYCFQDPSIGPMHRPGPRPGRGRWRYTCLGVDYDYERWDPAPYWDEYWLPPRWRNARYRRYDNPYFRGATFRLRRERIKLMWQRLRASRNSRRHGEAEWSVAKWRQYNDELAELDERIEDLNRMWSHLEDDSDTDSSGFGSDD